jgi:hypothetical protein
LGNIFDIFSYLFDADFLCVFETALLQVVHAKGTRRPHFRRALGAIWNTISTNMEKLNCDSVWEGMRKSSFGGLVFHLVLSDPCACFRDLFFHASFDDLSPFYTFVHPLEAHFLQHFAIISTIIFKHAKNRKIGLDPESRRVHLRHIKGNGETGRHLGSIWVASEHLGSGKHLGGIWETSTLGFPPLSRRCLLGAQGLLTNTVRIP